eukprot:scaffold246359_cov18-Prasinocladus_malaysianus.AAC.1
MSRVQCCAMESDDISCSCYFQNRTQHYSQTTSDSMLVCAPGHRHQQVEKRRKTALFRMKAMMLH